MRRPRYAEEQVAFALKQAELGTPVAEVRRKTGVSEATFFRWKQKHGGFRAVRAAPAAAARGGEHEAEGAERRSAPWRTSAWTRRCCTGRVGRKACRLAAGASSSATCRTRSR